MTEYKGYSIKSADGWGMKAIHSIGAGAIPKALKGTYTNLREAVKAIDLYLTEKETQNAKASSSGRGK